MASIRAFEIDDIPAVAALLRTHMARWALDESLLEATTLGSPWHDPELPSLVAVGEHGEVVGFVACQARRMRFDGAEIRGVCASDLIVSPEHRSGAPGVLLMTRVLAGPQEVTWSDSSTDEVVRIWRTVGGGIDNGRSADFTLFLRPARWLRSAVAARLGRGSADASVSFGAMPLSALRALRGGGEDPPGSGVEARDASPADVAQHLPAISNRVRVRVDWDEAQLAHTLSQVGRVSGEPTSRLVMRRGRPIGWYVYVRRASGVAKVLHLAANERSASTVLTELVDHATRTGCAVLTGRAEPHLQVPLRQRGAALRFMWQPVIRAEDPVLSAVLATDASLLTRLDGELSDL